MCILLKGVVWYTIVHDEWGEFHVVVGCIVHNLLIHELGADFIKDGMDTILRHLPSGNLEPQLEWLDKWCL